MGYATFEEAGWQDWHRVLLDGKRHTIHGTVKITTHRAYPLLVMLDGQNLFDVVEASYPECE